MSYHKQAGHDSLSIYEKKLLRDNTDILRKDKVPIVNFRDLKKAVVYIEFKLWDRQNKIHHHKLINTVSARHINQTGFYNN